MNSLVTRPTPPVVAVLTALVLAPSAATAGNSFERQEWRVPRTYLIKENPITDARNSIFSGQKIYLARCAACHGDTGRGNGEAARELRIRPAVLTKPLVQKQSDGALWWKITSGRRPMPAFGRRLTDAERWNVVNYLRSLAAAGRRHSRHPQIPELRQ